MTLKLTFNTDCHIDGSEIEGMRPRFFFSPKHTDIMSLTAFIESSNLNVVPVPVFSFLKQKSLFKIYFPDYRDKRPIETLLGLSLPKRINGA